MTVEESCDLQSPLRTHIEAAMAAGNSNVTDALLEPLRQAPILELVREMKPELTAAQSKTSPVALFMLSQAAIKRKTIYNTAIDTNSNISEVTDSMLVLFQFFTSKVGHFTTLDAAVEGIARVFEWWVTGRNSIDEDSTSNKKNLKDINKVTKHSDSSEAEVCHSDSTVDVHTAEQGGMINEEQVAIRRSLILPSSHPSFVCKEETEKKKMLIVREIIKNVFGRIQLQSMFGKSKVAAVRLLEVLIGVGTKDNDAAHIAAADALRLTLGTTTYSHKDRQATEVTSVLSASDFMSAFLTAMDGEREPELVLKSFRMTQRILLVTCEGTSSLVENHKNHERNIRENSDEINQNINDKVDCSGVYVPLLPLILPEELEPYVEDLFLNVSSYFPVLFSPPPFSVVSKDDIRTACHGVLGCPVLAKYTIPFLCDKLTSPAATTKEDSIELLHDIVKGALSGVGGHCRPYRRQEIEPYLFSLLTTIRLEMNKLVSITSEGGDNAAYMTILKALLDLISSVGELAVALEDPTCCTMVESERRDNSHHCKGVCEGAIVSSQKLLRRFLPVLFTVLRKETIEKLKSGHSHNQNEPLESLTKNSSSEISSKVDALIVNALAKSSNTLCSALANTILIDFAELLRPSLSLLPPTSDSIDLAMPGIADVKKLDKLITTLGSLFSAIETRKAMYDNVSSVTRKDVVDNRSNLADATSMVPVLYIHQSNSINNNNAEEDKETSLGTSVHNEQQEFENAVDIIMSAIYMVFTGITCPSSALHLIPFCGEVIATYIVIHDLIHYRPIANDGEAAHYKEWNSRRKQYLFQILVKRLLTASASELDEDGAKVIMKAVGNAGTVAVERETLVLGLFFSHFWGHDAVVRSPTPTLSIFPPALLLRTNEEAVTMDDDDGVGSTYFLGELSSEERLPALLEILINKVGVSDIMKSNDDIHPTCVASSPLSLIILERLFLCFHGKGRCTINGCVSMCLQHANINGPIIMTAASTLGLDSSTSGIYNTNGSSSTGSSLLQELMRVASELLSATFIVQKQQLELQEDQQMTSSASLLVVIAKKIFNIIHPISNISCSSSVTPTSDGSLLRLLESSTYGPDIVASLLRIVKELSVSSSANSSTINNDSNVNNSNCDDIIRVCLDNCSHGSSASGMLLWACGMEVASKELLDTYPDEVKTKWFEMAIRESINSSSNATACHHACALRAISALANKWSCKMDFNYIIHSCQRNLTIQEDSEIEANHSHEQLLPESRQCQLLPPPKVLTAVCLGKLLRGAPVLEAFDPLLHALYHLVTERSCTDANTLHQYYTKHEAEVIAGFGEVLNDRKCCHQLVMSKFWRQRSFCEITKYLMLLGTGDGKDAPPLMANNESGSIYYNYFRLRLLAIMCCNEMISTVSNAILEPVAVSLISRLEDAMVKFPAIPISQKEENNAGVLPPHTSPSQRPYLNHALAMADVLAISAAALKGIMIIATREPVTTTTTAAHIRRDAVWALLRVNNRCYNNTVIMEPVVGTGDSNKACDGRKAYHINIGHHLVSSILQEPRCLMRRLMERAADIRGAPDTSVSPLTLLARGLLFDAPHSNNAQDTELVTMDNATAGPIVSKPSSSSLSAVFDVYTSWPPLTYDRCPVPCHNKHKDTAFNSHIIPIREKLAVIDAFKAIIHTVIYMSDDDCNDADGSGVGDSTLQDVRRHTHDTGNTSRKHVLELCKNEKSSVLRLLCEQLGDRKRLVRTDAGKCRHEWFKLK